MTADHNATALTFTTIRQPNGDIRVTEYENGQLKSFSDVGQGSIDLVVGDLKARGYTRAVVASDLTFSGDTLVSDDVAAPVLYTVTALISGEVRARDLTADEVTAWLSNRTNTHLWRIERDDLPALRMNGADWQAMDALPVPDAGIHCPCCNHRMVVATQPALMPNRPATYLATCWTPGCELYSMTLDTRDMSAEADRAAELTHEQVA